jgi:hypothetical protein
LGLLCMPPFKRACPLSSVLALPPMHACPRALFLPLGGSFMPFGTLVHAPPLMCVPKAVVRAPQGVVRASPWPCVPPTLRACPPFTRAHPPLQPCVPPRCDSRSHLTRVCPLHLLEMLAWKSTSPLPMPCQPTVLTGGKI